jgi:hypothetical protein
VGRGRGGNVAVDGGAAEFVRAYGREGRGEAFGTSVSLNPFRRQMTAVLAGEHTLRPRPGLM